MNDIQILKRFYGEKFAHLCRSTFPLILENETMLPKLIMDNFAPSKALYDDLASDKKMFVRFKDFIFEKYHEHMDLQKVEATNTNKTAEELMAEAGYTLYPECKQFKDMLQFKKYFAPNEVLCSFDPLNDRLNNCRVWFAVKNGAEKLNRKEFKHPEREDEYGTSVISIQFTKDLHSNLSIKNRYNHAVAYPDSTFHNDLDEIIPGLTHAFCTEYGITPLFGKYAIVLNIPNYERANDGKYFKTIKRIRNNCYICENNYVLINGEPYHFDPDRYLLLDNGDLIDTKEKKISPAYIEVSDNKNSKMIEEYNNDLKPSSFSQSFDEIAKIDISKNVYGGKTVLITPKEEENRCGEQVALETDCSNQIVEVFDPMRTSPENYLSTNTKIKSAYFPNLKIAKTGFMQCCNQLKELTANKLETIKHNCLTRSYKMKSLTLPKLKSVGDISLQEINLDTFSAPELETIGQYCLRGNIKNFSANKLKQFGRASLAGKIENFEANSLETLPELDHGVKNISAKNATDFACKCKTAWTYYAKSLVSADVKGPELQQFFDEIIERNQRAKLEEIEEKSQSR